jgi:hypothetical protein
MDTWRDSETAIVGEATRAHDAFATTCLHPGERVRIAATHTFFLINSNELSAGPVFVTDSRILGGQERLLRKGFKSFRANLSDVRRFSGDLMSGVGPMWELHGVGLVDVKIVFGDPLEGERFTRLTQLLFGE